MTCGNTKSWLGEALHQKKNIGQQLAEGNLNEHQIQDRYDSLDWRGVDDDDVSGSRSLL